MIDKIQKLIEQKIQMLDADKLQKIFTQALNDYVKYPITKSKSKYLRRIPQSMTDKNVLNKFFEFLSGEGAYNKVGFKFSVIKKLFKDDEIAVNNEKNAKNENAIYKRIESANSALAHQIIKMFQSELIKQSVQKNNPVYTHDKKNSLHHAVLLGDKELVKFLLDQDCNALELDSSRNSALKLSSDSDDPEILEIILNHKNFFADESIGYTLLHIVLRLYDLTRIFDDKYLTRKFEAMLAKIRMLNKELRQQIWKCASSKRGDTIVHLAVQMLFMKNSQLWLLVKSGVDLTIKNNDGNTALDIAVKYVTNFPQYVALLILGEVIEFPKTNDELENFTESESVDIVDIANQCLQKIFELNVSGINDKYKVFSVLFFKKETKSIFKFNRDMLSDLISLNSECQEKLNILIKLGEEMGIRVCINETMESRFFNNCLSHKRDNSDNSILVQIEDIKNFENYNINSIPLNKLS